MAADDAGDVCVCVSLSLSLSLSLSVCVCVCVCVCLCVCVSRSRQYWSAHSALGAAVPEPWRIVVDSLWYTQTLSIYETYLSPPLFHPLTDDPYEYRLVLVLWLNWAELSQSDL